MKADEAGGHPSSKLVRLVWGDLGGAPAILANNVLLQFDGSMVFLTFGQAAPPLVAGETEDEKREQLSKIESVPVSTMVRLAVPVENYRAMVGAFQKHLAVIGKRSKSEKEET